MLSQSEAPDNSLKEIPESVMVLAQCSKKLHNDAASDTTGDDSSNL
jgi:hypothetical protein